MPIYKYECTECKTEFEKLQKFSDKPVKECPDCGSSVKKAVTSANIQFKGTGFYSTDY